MYFTLWSGAWIAYPDHLWLALCQKRDEAMVVISTAFRLLMKMLFQRHAVVSPIFSFRLLMSPWWRGDACSLWRSSSSLKPTNGCKVGAHCVLTAPPLVLTKPMLLRFQGQSDGNYSEPSPESNASYATYSLSVILWNGNGDLKAQWKRRERESALSSDPVKRAKRIYTSRLRTKKELSVVLPYDGEFISFPLFQQKSIFFWPDFLSIR